MDAYDIPGACAHISAFVDALNNWYIRRSRERFWRHADSDETQAAYDTLYTALVTLVRVASPLLPFLCEEIYRGLTGERSVHLLDWPDATTLPHDPALVSHMDRARDVCSAALALRRAENVRVRQPLRALTVAGADVEGLRPYLQLIRDEVNVKEVELSEEITRYASFRLQVDARTLGPRFGSAMKDVLRATRSGEWKSRGDGRIEVAGQLLESDEYTLRLEPKAGVVCQALAGHDAIVVLDLELSSALIQEGVARDLVRLVQQARRDAELHVSDRIELALELPRAAREAVTAFRDYIAEQTLAVDLMLDAVLEGDGISLHTAELANEPVRIALRRA
jgi:isoleucyl-tRNA synthetase